MGEKFEVRDKRTMDSQGNPRAVGPHEEPKTQATHGNAQAAGREKREQGPASSKMEKRDAHQHGGRHAHGEEHAERHEGHENEHHGADFLSFVVNLAGMAYMTMGLGEVPTEPNLPEAKYIIDSLDMLKEKTMGNLSAEEEKGMSGLLYELKMNFSKVASGKRP